MADKGGSCESFDLFDSWYLQNAPSYKPKRCKIQKIQSMRGSSNKSASADQSCHSRSQPKLHGNEHRSNSNCQINMVHFDPSMFITVCLCFAASRRVWGLGAKRGTGATHITHTHKHLQMLMRNEHAIYPIPARCRSSTSHRVASHLSHPIIAHIHVHIQPHAKRRSSVQHGTTQYGSVCMFLIHLTWNTIPMNPTMTMINVIYIYIYMWHLLYTIACLHA